MLSVMASACAAVIAFPRWRIKRRAGQDIFAILAELEALDRAQARLLWTCFAIALGVLGSLEALTLS